MSEPSPRRSFTAVIFMSPSEPRLRAGWRILLQTILFGLFFCVMAFPVAWFGPGKSQTWIMSFSTSVECFAITVSIFYARRFFDKRSFVSLGLSLKGVWLKDIFTGIGISMLMMGLIFIIALSSNWVEVGGFSWTTDGSSKSIGQTILWLLIFILVGWQEELLSRGYQLQNISEGMNLTWGVLISSTAFALSHLLNPGANWISTFGIFLAGLFLSLGYILTGQLWLPIGLHIGWNFFEGVVFGFPVSGLNPYALVKVSLTGPEIWTGGQFGPEAGLLLLPALLLGAILVFIYSKNRIKND
jgi:membrane protease YdiL (CAAX protease family)